MKNIVKQNLTFEKYVIPDVDAQIAEFKKKVKSTKQNF